MKRIGLIAFAAVVIIFVSISCPERDTMTSTAPTAGIVIQ